VGEVPNDTNDDEITPVKANHSADGVNETDMVDDSLRAYLSQIDRVSLLTAKDERALARALESGAYVEHLEREFTSPQGEPGKACEVILRMLTECSKLGFVAEVVAWKYELQFPIVLKEIVSNQEFCKAVNAPISHEAMQTVADHVGRTLGQLRWASSICHLIASSCHLRHWAL